MEDFNFIAPQYVDFTSTEFSDLSGYGEEYFDMDHEELEKLYVKAEEVKIPDSPEQIETDPLKIDDSQVEERPKLRRSVSAGQILTQITKMQAETCGLSSAMEALHLSETKTNNSSKSVRNKSGVRQNILPSKCNFSEPKHKLKNDSSLNKPLKYRRRAMSRDAINKIGVGKPEQLKRKISSENLQPNKYISIAEAINKFQFSTPKRYHSKPLSIQFQNSKATAALAPTIPQSPMLSTKQRVRGTDCVSREEKEEMEAEEMKKHQIKAHSVNYKILNAPVSNPVVEKKGITVPKPFKFAEVQFHKPVEPPKPEVYEFHARPAPKTTSVPVIINPRRSVVPVPTPKPKIRETLYKCLDGAANTSAPVKKVEICHDGIPGIPMKSNKTLSKTKPEPFSFEERDKRMRQKKEEKIKKFLEEEKKAREFHARPILAKIANGSGQVESKVAKLVQTGFGSSSSINKNDENVEPPSQNIFKARPATVIHKKPFVPKKEERPLTEASEFSLSSDKRAKDREEFDRKMKEKEEEYERMKQEREELQKAQELKEIDRLRKEAVHKANPVKHYKPVEIHPSNKKITSPISPMLSKRRITRMEN